MQIATFDQKIQSFSSAVNFFSIFGHQNPGLGLDPERIRLGIQPKMLDPDPESMNPDQKKLLSSVVKSE
jgi:hypothetical protein